MRPLSSESRFNKQTRTRAGFGYKELLGILAMFMLVAFMIPPVTQWMMDAKLRQMIKNGRATYQAAQAASDDSQAYAFPKTGAFQATHDYFISLVTNQYMNVSYGYFAGPGLMAHHSPEWEGFESVHCAWKVSVGQSRAPSQNPFLVTRNFTPSKIPESINRYDVGETRSGNPINRLDV